LPTVLVVDDVPGNRRLLTALLEPAGYVVRTASDGAEALQLVRAEAPDLVLMDVMMPEVDGLVACRAIKDDPATRFIPVVLVTSLDGSASRIAGIEAGADDFLSKPFDVHELQARVRSLLRLKHFTDELDSAEAIILSLAQTIEARDHATHGHCQRLARYATAMGDVLGLDDEDLGALARGGVLHDVGKIGIPDAILLKTGRLTPAEHDLIKQHTIIGDQLIGDLRLLRRVRPIIRNHHERYDGSGYPDGLRGEAIPLLAQIIGIVDVFDALTTARPYKVAQTFPAAAEDLRAEAARGLFRPDLVDLFLERVVAVAGGAGAHG